MNRVERDKHWELLEQCLKKLSSSMIKENDNDKLFEYVNEFKKIYANDYRHEYSQVFHFILEIREKEDIEFLSNNIVNVLNYLDENSDIANDEIINKISKLLDHITLEIQRLQYYINRSFIENIKINNEDIKKEIKEIKEDKNKINIAYRKTKANIENLQKDFITVIGIFITIIVTITSGTSILSSAFTSVSSLPIHRSILYISLASIAVSNITTSFVYMISKILDKDISIQCKSKSCDSCIENCSPFEKYKIKYPYLFYMNQFFMILFLICLVFEVCLSLF